jgi:hypothetical protein
MKAMKRRETVHGFRSSFSDWAADNTAFPQEVRQQALAHAIPNKVEAAYRRGALLEKRRRLMADWATFCAALVGDVVPIEPTWRKRDGRKLVFETLAAIQSDHA